jgi:hypothetical protein
MGWFRLRAGQAVSLFASSGPFGREEGCFLSFIFKKAGRRIPTHTLFVNIYVWTFVVRLVPIDSIIDFSNRLRHGCYSSSSSIPLDAGPFLSIPFQGSTVVIER